MMANLGFCFFLTNFDKVTIVHNFDQMELEKIMLHMLLATWKRGNLPKWPHVAPPTLRVTAFIQICSRKSNLCGSSSFGIHITYYYSKVSNFLQFTEQPE